MKRSICAGIDVGYGYTKIVADSGGQQPDQLIMPSVAGSGIDVSPDIDGLLQINRQAVEIDGNTVLVGDSALKHSARIFNAREKNWLSSVAYKALLKTALSHLITENVNLIVVSGLPVKFFKTDKSKLVNLIKRMTGELAIYAKVRVIPQPLGTLFNLLFDDSGMVQDGRLTTSRVGVIDIGFHTTDIITIDNLELVEKQTASFENGVAGTLEALANQIEKDYDFRPDLHKVEEAIRTGCIRAFGQEQIISDIAKSKLVELATDIEARAKTVWKSAGDLDFVVITGGGAALLRDYLHLYAHAVIMEGAQFANAIGYYKFAQRLSYEE
jgi:plasmid segregation protein ParM